ncbi:sulfotransferase [Sinimarinibacterium sp. CAU 1509]|uniref:sulfotransferase n=1 Tax=Sinimarinibacterium sp. CAU 1509 TaxID=2562283 RepID=UPI00146AAFC4|nr:sulfotransferase [Sinimarinibacterium sp. CAU 1509]
MRPVDPIFILAAPFSGASFAAAILGQHPSLFAVPQLDLFMADYVGELLEIVDIGQGAHGDGLMRALAVLEFGGQDDDHIERARRWLQSRADVSTAEILHTLATMAAPRRLVVPDVETPLRTSDLLRLRTAAPRAEILQLLRHPYAQGLVQAAWLRERLFVPADFKDHSRQPPVIDPQLGWFRVHHNIERLLAHEAQIRIVRQRIEDIDVASVASLHALCTALGLPAEDVALAAMAQPDDWSFAGFGPPSAPYGLEADVLESITLPRRWDQTPRLEGVLPWRDDGCAFSPDLVELARDLGYA